MDRRTAASFSVKEGVVDRPVYPRVQMDPMKAIRYHRYGTPEVLQLDEVPAPVPRSGQVLVRVAAASVNPKDILLRKGRLRLLGPGKPPQIPGNDFAGTVEAVGRGVRSVAVGDSVFGLISGPRTGAYAEKLIASEHEVAPMPVHASVVEAAALPLVGLTALQALRDLAAVRPGDEVLLNGASGGVGTVAIQVAVALGARVTAVCSSRNVALVKKLGAADVIPYDTCPLTDVQRRFAVVFDIFGTCPFRRARPLLLPDGRYVTAIPSPRALARHLAAKLGLGRGFLVLVRSRRADLEQLTRWIARKNLRAVVDRVVPWEEAAEAHRYVETRRARGKVVLSVR